MTKLLTTILSTLMLTATVSAAAAPTAERHAAKGIQCVSCHADVEKALPVRKAACLKCHGSYEAVAKRTEKIEPNPHFNHFGERDCSTCHKGHAASTVSCSQCHKFDLKTP